MSASEEMATIALQAPVGLSTATGQHRRSGPGLTLKIFASTAGVVALAIGGAIAFSSFRANQLMEEAVREAFRSTQYVFSNIEAARYDKLKRLNALVAGDPIFRATILDTDEATLADDLRSRRQPSLGSDFVLVTDPRGLLLARTNAMGAHGDDLSKWPLIAKALAGQSATGLLPHDGGLYHAVAIPVGVEGGELAGVLVSGYAVGDALADEMQKTTSTEVAFVTEKGGTPQIAASTLKRPDQGTALDTFARAQLAAPSPAPQHVEIAGVRYLGLLTPLTTPSGERAGGLIVLRSIAAELATFSRLRTSLVTTGLVAVGLAFLVSFLLAHGMTGPLRGLARVAEAVRAGNYNVDVPGSGGDEVGALAASIRSMVQELRGKAELERFVAELAAEPARAAAVAAAATLSGRPTLGGESGTGLAAVGSEPRAGEVLANRYEILEVIGTGGMGKVYKARDRELDEVVALKTIRKELLGGTTEAADRFKQEIKLARKATHKNILRTFDFGESGGVQFLTMEYVHGLTLRDLVKRNPSIPLRIGLRIATQVCTGLYAAHDAGVIHRDVKSQNIIIQPNGELKIMDFGIARPKESSGLTSTGAIIGTPEFMSPEQALGREADYRSDIYSAGMVFYELFTGRLPFTGQAALEVVLKHVQEKPATPRSVKASVPAEIEAIILKMIEKDPANRYQSFAEVFSALSRIPVPAAAPRAA